MTLISEIGSDGIKKFAKSNAFTSFLGLAPDFGISGGKKLPSKTKHKTRSQLTKAFLDSAHTIGNSKQGILKEFHTKICFRIGRKAANKATARKLATIIFHMLTKKKPYEPYLNEEIQKRKKQKSLNLINKQIKKHGFKLEDLQCVLH